MPRNPKSDEGTGWNTMGESGSTEEIFAEAVAQGERADARDSGLSGQVWSTQAAVAHDGRDRRRRDDRSSATLGDPRRGQLDAPPDRFEVDLDEDLIASRDITDS